MCTISISLYNLQGTFIYKFEIPISIQSYGCWKAKLLTSISLYTSIPYITENITTLAHVFNKKCEEKKKKIEKKPQYQYKYKKIFWSNIIETSSWINKRGPMRWNCSNIGHY